MKILLGSFQKVQRGGLLLPDNIFILLPKQQVPLIFHSLLRAWRTLYSHFLPHVCFTLVVQSGVYGVGCISR